MFYLLIFPSLISCTITGTWTQHKQGDSPGESNGEVYNLSGHWGGVEEMDHACSSLKGNIESVYDWISGQNVGEHLTGSYTKLFTVFILTACKYKSL